ncbi:MAG: glycoside hydrolase family 3 C-terminal domain-containing protein [Lachnospiraceae bacterium]|nr:glycoside hydrolase family 3 C-terminal domain-containing protein [Lachnospiraceae bacterium]
MILDQKIYQKTARQMAAEGCVLLKNDEQALPLRKGDQVALFGRAAFDYYKSGLGSGGMVNTGYVVGIFDALKDCPDIILNQDLLTIYNTWMKENPVDKGKGWGSVPWSQKEMPVTAEMEQIAQKADVSLVVIGRTAGEDQDNNANPGSFLLTETEREMIDKVSRACKRTIVILNVGNIIDMKWVKEADPAGVLYVWQGGQEGGNGVVDVLTGKVNPCGRLTDTIANDICDYPSTKNFGGRDCNIYEEDIYVGYRYFETFARDKVLYPFGFGLSYTDFEMEGNLTGMDEDGPEVTVTVKNIGKAAGKEVVFLFVRVPQGCLGQPDKMLIGFAKTKELEPGEKISLSIKSKFWYFASYDENGVTGNPSAFVLEEGTYELFVGKDIRDVQPCGTWQQKQRVIRQAGKACAPQREFSRMVCKTEKDGRRCPAWEDAPTGTGPSWADVVSQRNPELPYTGDKGISLADVYYGKADMETFVAQLTEEDLICLFHAEGMCSPKVTPGTASAFGGVTESLRDKGIPVACCADGPSGIRMDCGTKAFSIPNGTSIGCSFNLELTEKLFENVGLEMRKNRIDTLLGPGMNIRRNPLNGRNFEYFSEDPLLTGWMAAAQIKGMERAGVTGTIKHFCCNNQEQGRNWVDAVVSERALREIYLRGFEIAVKEGGARSIMTAYGPTNGIWAAGNYELLTTILRGEWGYDGIVMTDWWANANWNGEYSDKQNRAPMVIAQNDLFMVCPDSMEELEKDNVKAMLERGVVEKSDLQRNAINILTFLMKSPAMLRELGQDEEVRTLHYEDEQENIMEENIEQMETDLVTGVAEAVNLPMEGSVGMNVWYGVKLSRDGRYEIEMDAHSEFGELAQLLVSVYMDNEYRTTLSFQGSQGRTVTRRGEVGVVSGKAHTIRLFFAADGIWISKMRLIPVGEQREEGKLFFSTY